MKILMQDEIVKVIVKDLNNLKIGNYLFKKCFLYLYIQLIINDNYL